MLNIESLNPLVYNGVNPELWMIANEVVDPEIPALSVVDLGIVRDIKRDGESIEVSITPTYSGCPAMDMIATDIKKAFQQKGFPDITIKTILSPTWTTDWMSDDAKERLRVYGISPPEHSADKNTLLGKSKTVLCPRCRSEHTEMISNFGSTACKALWKCLDCKEPFDHFKCI